jgi:hypothetical protein
MRECKESVMVGIIVVTLLALIMVCVVLIKSRNIDPDQLVQPRPGMMTMGVQIICGDCSGEDYHARRTYLDRNGKCSQCGGRSYLLASAAGAFRAYLRAARLRELDSGTSHGRVIPFAVPASRASRKKIAM